MHCYQLLYFLFFFGCFFYFVLSVFSSSLSGADNDCLAVSVFQNVYPCSCHCHALEHIVHLDSIRHHTSPTVSITDHPSSVIHCSPATIHHYIHHYRPSFIIMSSSQSHTQTLVTCVSTSISGSIISAFHLSS